jgi:hypothetical protein|tara:strand:- start:153 stop:374 length:222 start_codon:yes stop_codon:yes gene_type:complete
MINQQATTIDTPANDSNSRMHAAFELTQFIDYLIDSNRHTGRSIDAMIAVENTLRQVQHELNDIDAYYAGGTL